VIPGWVLVSGVIMFVLSLLSGTLVLAARQKSDNGETCIKFLPISGPYSYVYFDTSIGTRLNMPQDSITAVSYQQISPVIDSPDRTKQAVIMESTTSPIAYVAVTNAINGKRHIRNIGSAPASFEGWSSDGKYIAVSLRALPSITAKVAILSGHNLKDVMSISRNASNGVWSNHGHRVAFIEQRASNPSLTIVDVAQSTATPHVTEFALSNEYRIYSRTDELRLKLLWSPDDQYIAITTPLTAAVVPMNGDPVVQVSNQLLPFGNDNGASQVIWMPNSSALIYQEYPIQVNTPGTLKAYYPRERLARTLATQFLSLVKYSPEMNLAILSRASSLDGSPFYSLLSLTTGTESDLTPSEASEYLAKWGNRRPTTNLEIETTSNRYSWNVSVVRGDTKVHWNLPNIGTLSHRSFHWFTCANLS
jgi:hypothetical protein